MRFTKEGGEGSFVSNTRWFFHHFRNSFFPPKQVSWTSSGSRKAFASPQRFKSAKCYKIFLLKFLTSFLTKNILRILVVVVEEAVF